MSTDSPWVTAVRLVVVVSVLIIPVPYHPCVVDSLCTSDGKILSNIGESALLAGPQVIVVEDTLLGVVLSYSGKLSIPYL